MAFSAAFLVGPMIGAWFAKRARTNELFLATPALFAIVLTIIEILCIAFFLPETLPKEKRVKLVVFKCCGYPTIRCCINYALYSILLHIPNEFSENENVEYDQWLAVVRIPEVALQFLAGGKVDRIKEFVYFALPLRVF